MRIFVHRIDLWICNKRQKQGPKFPTQLAIKFPTTFPRKNGKIRIGKIGDNRGKLGENGEKRGKVRLGDGERYLSRTFGMCHDGGFWHFLPSFAIFASMCESKGTRHMLMVGNSKEHALEGI